MKILVTGGAGYIASHTNVVLQQNGYDIIAIDNLANSTQKSLERVEQITGKTIKFYNGDVRDKALLNTIFAENEIQAVIHFAGLKAVGESCVKPLLYYENNLMANIALVETMAKNNVKKLVFSSSATVYGIPKELPLTENSPLSTTNPYGATKLMGEQIFADTYHADNDWNIVLLRYFNPVGAHQSGLIGEDPKGIPNNLMPYIAQVAIGKLSYLNVFGDDYNTHDGTGVRDYIHIMDLADAHLLALQKIEDYGVEAINVGTGQGYSVLEMIKAFEQASGKKISYKISPRRPGDIDACYAACEKAKRELGFEAKRSLLDMCKDLWNWQIKNPQGYV